MSVVRFRAKISANITRLLSLSSSLTECVCVCVARRVAFFPPLSLPFFVLTSSSTKQLQRRSQKIKKRERSLSFSLSLALSSTKKRFLPPSETLFLSLREFFLWCRKQKKKAEKSKTFARNVFTKRAHSRMREEREKKTSDFERIELFSSSRCVLSLFFALARRRGRNFARRIERERGQRFAIFTSCLLTLQRER